MWIADNWKDYEILDTSDGEKLERWGKYILLRPDPQVIWKSDKKNKNWKSLNGHYHRSSKGGGEWEFFDLPNEWQISYCNGAKFNLKPFAFKHTGLFPEQAVNWDWFSYIIKKEKEKNPDKPIKVLNLFAYTGGATIAASLAGAEVTHVDASKGMNDWAKENAKLSNLENNKIRYICDDCLKFVEREKKRGNKYDAIIMDPPTYGRGPSKELWRFEDSLNKLIDSCIDIMSDDPLFLLISSYTKGITPEILKNILITSCEKLKNGKITTDEIGLKITNSHLILPCGVYGRWEKNEN